MQKLLDPLVHRALGGPPVRRLVRRGPLDPDKRIGVPRHPGEQLESLLEAHPVDSGGDVAAEAMIFFTIDSRNGG